jgi:hypothetical protein
MLDELLRQNLPLGDVILENVWEGYWMEWVNALTI